VCGDMCLVSNNCVCIDSIGFLGYFCGEKCVEFQGIVCGETGVDL